MSSQTELSSKEILRLQQRVIELEAQLAASQQEQESQRQNESLFRDITEHKQTELALRASERKYRRLIESLNEGVWLLDSQTVTQFANEQLARMLGYTTAEMIGKPLCKFMDRANLDKALKVVEKREAGEAGQTEYELIRKDGTHISVLLSFTPIFDDEGRFDSVLAGVVDITTRKQFEHELAEANRVLHKQREELRWLNENLEQMVAERTQALATEIEEHKRSQDQLRTSTEMFERLFEAAPDATALVDAEGIILRTNDQMVQQFGYSKDEMVGQPIEFLIPQRFRQNHLRLRAGYYTRPVTRPMGQGLQLYALRKDGNEFPVDIMLSPVRIDEHLQVICVIHDITRRKQIEAELAEVQRLLVRSREAERIHLAQELHDGPMQELSAINFQLAMLSTNLSDTTQSSAITAIHSQLEEVNRILRHMANQLRPPVLARFGLAIAMRTHLEQFQELHPDLRIQLSVQGNDESVTEEIAFAVYRICQQALNNVVQHAQAQNVYVYLDRSTQQICLEVADDGQGFEVPATWIEMARQNHLGVVGMVERAETIGGRLEVESTPGKGTIVRVVVPQKNEVGHIA